MTRFSLRAVCAVAGLAFAQSAWAADMAVKAPPPPLPPPCIWCGFYIGVNAGYGWGEQAGGNLTAFTTGLGIPGAVAAGTIPSFFDVRPQGWVAGGQAGYNWQVNQFVFGVEADFQGTGIRQTATIFNPGAGGFTATLSTAKDELDWFGTVRGRLGWAWNNVLLYGTGGFAYGYVADNVAVNTVPPFSPINGASNSTRTGWAAGAGIEWALGTGWSVRGEYLHIDLGSTTARQTFSVSATDFLDYRFKHEYDIARVGFNYKFNWGAPLVAKY